MLTQLSTVKSRLGIAGADTQYDALLTQAIAGLSAQFDRECNRRLARTVDAVQEFHGDKLELCLECYPIETVTRFDRKADEASGWVEVANVDYLVRGACVISLGRALGTCGEQARLVYTGGYVLPGSVPGQGQTALPEELHHAAIEQVASWFQNRDKLGLVKNWPSSGTFQQFMMAPLLPLVQTVLRRHERLVV
jgi:hypothetical protein